MGLSSVTHGIDVGQRAIELSVSHLTGDRLVLTSPTNHNIALPGYYHLFLLDDNGVPSEGELIRLDPTAPTVNNAPKAAFAATPGSPETGQAVALADRSTDSDGQVVAWAWDLDDDGEFDDASTAATTRTFKTAGNHVVRLRVVDDRGAANVAVETITVRAGKTGAVEGVPAPVELTHLKSLHRELHRGHAAVVEFTLSTRTDIKLILARAGATGGARFFQIPANAGPNRVKLTGRMIGRGLRPGTYRITVKPIGGASMKLTLPLK